MSILWRWRHEACDPTMVPYITWIVRFLPCGCGIGVKTIITSDCEPCKLSNILESFRIKAQVRWPDVSSFQFILQWPFIRDTDIRYPYPTFHPIVDRNIWNGTPTLFNIEMYGFGAPYFGFVRCESYVIYLYGDFGIIKRRKGYMIRNTRLTEQCNWRR